MKTMQNTASRRGVSERARVLPLLALATALYFFANFQRTVIPGSIFSELQSDLDISAAAVAGFGAAFMYFYAASQLFVGVLADRFGGYRLITVGGGLFCFGSLIFPFSDNTALLYVCRIVTGIGASTIYLSLVKEIQRAYPANFAPVLGAAMLVGYLGSMTANAPFIALIRCTGWRNGLIGFSLAMLLVWGIFFALRRSLRISAPEGPRLRLLAFAPAVDKRHNWALFLLTGLSFAVFFVFLTVLGKKFLEDFCRMTPLAAGWVMTISGALAALSSFVMPVLSRLAGNRRRPFLRFMGTGTLLCTGGALIALWFEWHSAWFFCGVLLLLACCANMTPVFLALLAETNPPENLGVCASFSNFLAYLMVALLGHFSGVMMDLFEPEIVDGVRVYGTNSYLAVFGLCTAAAAVAFAASLMVKESRGRRLEVR